MCPAGSGEWQTTPFFYTVLFLGPLALYALYRFASS
eukprot:COSAG02_NODE_39286_length_419_cov_0.634375_1_plen_35_part_10